MPTFPGEGNIYACTLYMGLLSVWYGIVTIVFFIVLCLLSVNRFPSPPLIGFTSAVLARFGSVVGLLISSQCYQPTRLVAIEAFNSAPTLLFMASATSLLYYLVEPYSMSPSDRRLHLKLGLLLSFVSLLFLVSLLSISYLPGSATNEILGRVVFILYFLYFGLIGLGFFYAVVFQYRCLKIHPADFHSFIGITVLLSVLMIVRSGAMLVGAVSDPLNYHLFDFEPETNNILPYFYYLFTDLLCLVLIGFVIVTHQKIRSEVEKLLRDLSSCSVPLMEKRGVRKYSEKVPDQLQIFEDFPKIESSDLQLEEQIGRGAFSTVYRARWHGTLVAVKQFNVPLHFASPRLLEDMAAEMRLLSNVRHPNVLYYLGTTPPPQVSIVTEFMELSSLQKVLNDPVHEQTLNLPGKKEDIVKQIVSGMEYLHGEGILHRDLCPNNLLVSRVWNIKIGDLGVAQMKSSQSTPRFGRGTPAYTAPEVLDGNFFTASDVFSFGVTVWQIFSGKDPWTDPDLPVLNIFSRVRKGERPSLLVGSIPSFFRDLVCMCWDQQWQVRPSFGRIRRMIEGRFDKKDDKKEEKELVGFEEMERIGELQEDGGRSGVGKREEVRNEKEKEKEKEVERQLKEVKEEEEEIVGMEVLDGEKSEGE